MLQPPTWRIRILCQIFFLLDGLFSLQRRSPIRPTYHPMSESPSPRWIAFSITEDPHPPPTADLKALPLVRKIAQENNNQKVVRTGADENTEVDVISSIVISIINFILFVPQIFLGVVVSILEALSLNQIVLFKSIYNVVVYIRNWLGAF